MDKWCLPWLNPNINPLYSKPETSHFLFTYGNEVYKTYYKNKTTLFYWHPMVLCDNEKVLWYRNIKLYVGTVRKYCSYKWIIWYLILRKYHIIRWKMLLYCAKDLVKTTKFILKSISRKYRQTDTLVHLTVLIRPHGRVHKIDYTLFHHTPNVTLYYMPFPY